MSELLDAIPDVDIDDNGTFKYILIHVFDGDKDEVKTILRGYLREFHGFSVTPVAERQTGTVIYGVGSHAALYYRYGVPLNDAIEVLNSTAYDHVGRT